MNSYWIESTSFPNFSPLEENLSCDICIVGGGIMGITLAYFLTKAGKKVIVLEKDKIACSTTGNTTAKITSQHGLFYSYLMDTFGIDYAKRYLDANEEAIKDIEKIIQEEKIDCDFEKQDSYVFTEQLKEVDKLKQEQEAMEKLNFPSQLVDKVPLPIEVRLAIKFPNQAQFHVRKYLHGLINAIVKENGILYEDSLVEDVQKVEDSYITSCRHHKIKSKYVVIATKYPFINIPGFYFMKMYQSMSYAIAIKTQTQPFEGMYINSELPTMSFRTIKDGENHLVLIVGSDHKTGAKIDLSNAYASLEDIAKKMYPDSKVKYRWHTEDCISVDKLPYVGTYSTFLPHAYVATGFKKWGMTISNIAAHIIADDILGIPNKKHDLFLSTRFSPIKNAGEVKNILKESTYSLVINKMNSPEKTTKEEEENYMVEEIPQGEGKIVSIDGQKVGIYRNENDEFFKVKPICSHFGCELSFNNLTKTWDCPCHGSRFDYTGHCIYGPSVQGLEFLGTDTPSTH